MRTEAELTSWMVARGGVAHTSTLRAAGFTAHGIRCAVASGALEWVRRSWLALPAADRSLRAAATVAGRVTCASAASRLGLWVPTTPQEVHVSVAPSASRLEAAGVHLHWARGPMPVEPHAVEDPVINVLFHVARCLPTGEALAVWESALRMGRVDAAVLARVRWGSAAAARLAAVASVLSDSGLETAFAQIVRPLGVPFRQQVWIDGHRVDALVGEKLVTQLDGFAHHRAAERRRDIEADARLALRGFTVLRFDYQQVLFRAAEVREVVATAIAQGLHH
jgi:very-short-patch-repair endonuclease